MILLNPDQHLDSIMFLKSIDLSFAFH